MSRSLTRALLSALLPLWLSLSAAPARAAWPHDRSVNVSVCTAATWQEHMQAIPDGAGGIIMTWMDQRSGNYDIYAQRLSADGRALWTANGLPVCTAANAQEDPVLCGDGAGGAIIAWQDLRNSTEHNIYAQRVSAAGAALWATNGALVNGQANSQYAPAIASDGAGGAVLAWSDLRSGTNSDIYGQRINGTGAAQWAAQGLAICTAAGNQESSRLAADGAGGYVCIWQDNRVNGANDLYGQRLNGSGAIQWGVADGVAICTAASSQFNYRVVADAQGWSTIVWDDNRSGNFDVYVQRVTDTGGLYFTNGTAVCNATGDQRFAAIASDGGYGAYIAWQDSRGGSTSDIYAQHVDGSAVSTWTANGVAVCSASLDQKEPVVAADGSGGVCIAWTDYRRGNQDIYAQRLDAMAQPFWSYYGEGLAVSTTPQQQFTPAIVPDGTGGAILAWSDQRISPQWDLYAQRVFESPRISGVKDIPNDQGGKVRLAWEGSFLDPGIVGEYVIWRQVPAAQARAGHGVFTTTVQNGQAYSWEYLATVDAAAFEAYSHVAPTTGDSIAGSNPYTVFMVRAVSNFLPSVTWSSAPDSGYSVDNLAPATPMLFTGQYAAGTTRLQWNPGAESDLGTYRLYRGTAPDFVPDGTNLVAEVGEPGFMDVTPTPFCYKLCAVDVHGNAGPYALCIPAGTVSVEDAGLPRELWLARPAPNPMTEDCLLRFGLPRAAEVALAVYDQQGRRVRSVLATALPAGEHSARWDGRDEAGQAAPSGIYFVRIVVEGRTLTSRLAVVH